MAKKSKQYWERHNRSYDGQYHDYTDVSLGTFNEKYLQYLNEKQEFESQKMKVQWQCLYMLSDAVPNPNCVYCLVCYDAGVYIYLSDSDVSLSDVQTFLNPWFFSYGMGVSYQLIEENVPDANLTETFLAWLSDFSTYNSVTSMQDRFSGEIDPDESMQGRYNSFMNYVIDELFGMTKVFKPRIDNFDEVEEILDTEIPEEQMPIGLENFTTSEQYLSLTDVQKSELILALEEHISLFPGDWPETPQFHAMFYTNRTFYVPDYFTIVDASNEFPNHIVMVSVFFPYVSDIIVIPRWRGVAYHQWVNYEPIDQIDLDRVAVVVKQEFIAEITKARLNWFQEYQYFFKDERTENIVSSSTDEWGYGQWTKQYSYYIASHHCRPRAKLFTDISELQDYVIRMSRSEGALKLNQMVRNIYNGLVTTVLAASAYRMINLVMAIDWSRKMSVFMANMVKTNTETMKQIAKTLNEVYTLMELTGIDIS